MTGFCQDCVAMVKSQINMFLRLFGPTANFSPGKAVCVVTQLTFSLVCDLKHFCVNMTLLYAASLLMYF